MYNLVPERKVRENGPEAIFEVQTADDLQN